MDRISGFEPEGVGSIPAGPANHVVFLQQRLTQSGNTCIIDTIVS